MTQLSLKKHLPLFSSPLFVFDLAVPDLNARLLEDIESLRAHSPGIRASNRHGWHSERDFFERSEPSFRALAEQIKLALAVTSKKLNPQLNEHGLRTKLEGWINVNGKGAYNGPHQHEGSHLSGSYYVAVPASLASGDFGGAIEFLDPRNQALQAEGAQLTLGTKSFRVQPRAGMMLIFPSPLRHWVCPQEEDELRVSIAFNMRIMQSQIEGS